MATIIKQGSLPKASGDELRGVAYDFSDMAGQADQYLQDVRAEAAKIVQKAEAEAAEIRKQSEASGRQAAEQAIERILDQKVAKQMQTLTPALASAVQQVEDSRQDWLRHWEASATKLACEIAAKIIRRELEQQPEISLQWIQEALSMCAGNAEITIRINPTDAETLGSQIEELAKVFHPAAPANIISDANISVGGCRVETQFGSIDQQLETQLERLAEELS